MTNIKSMTSMTSMKWIVSFHAYIRCVRYAIVLLFIHRIIIILGYTSKDV